MTIHTEEQLLPNIVDGIAERTPETIYAEVPASPTTYKDGYIKINYRTLANAVNGVAWLLHDQLGEGLNYDTVAYIGPNDPTYVIMILGAIKAGFKILSVSPRNTVNDHIGLFKATDCNTLLTPSGPRSAAVQGILDAYPLKVIDSPNLYDLLKGDHRFYSYSKTFAEARHEPIFAVHTSGTTGIPKPIIYTHEFAASYIAWGRLSPPPGFESHMKLAQFGRMFVTSPFFHAGNLWATLINAIADQTIIVTPLSGAAPSAELVVEALEHVCVDSLVLVPPFLEAIASNSNMLEYVTKHVKLVFYGGGDVSKTAGDAFASRTRLFNMNGSTETSPYPTIYPSGRWPAEEWNYIRLHPEAGIDFRPVVSGSEVCEAVLIRKPELAVEQPVFKVFPNLTEYPTKDLFAPHPSRPDLWAHKGRKDNTIVFRPGYMCNPTAMELHVSQHPQVRSSLMVGTGRSQPALLVEPLGTERLTREGKNELVESIWPVVEEANKDYKFGAKVSRTHIHVLDHDQPMSYAGKGTVQRAQTLTIYQSLVDDLYARAGDRPPHNDLALPTPI